MKAFPSKEFTTLSLPAIQNPGNSVTLVPNSWDARYTIINKTLHYIFHGIFVVVGAAANLQWQLPTPFQIRNFIQLVPGGGGGLNLIEGPIGTCNIQVQTNPATVSRVSSLNNNGGTSYFSIGLPEIPIPQSVGANNVIINGSITCEIL